MGILMLASQDYINYIGLTPALLSSRLAWTT